MLLALLLGALPGAAADGGNLVILDAVWREARAAIHPAELADRHFTPAARAELEAAARTAPDLYAVAPALNRFLRGLGRSHTGFHHDRTIGFGGTLYEFLDPFFASRDGAFTDPQLERALAVARNALKRQPGPSIRRGSTMRSNSSAER
ncbi:MAG TPA: hypothetical protein VF210_07130 [Pseudomonadales bacterium]